MAYVGDILIFSGGHFRVCIAGAVILRLARRGPMLGLREEFHRRGRIEL